MKTESIMCIATILTNLRIDWGFPSDRSNANDNEILSIIEDSFVKLASL